MGLVFKARRDGDDRPVALKVLKRQLSGDLIYQQRFVHEARAAAEVRDPHLVRDPRIGRVGRAALPRLGLRRRRLAHGAHRRRAGRCSSRTPSASSPRSARGSTPCTRPGVMHRDIKPSNVLFDSDGKRTAHRLRPREGPRVHRPDQAGTGDGDARLPRAGADPGQAGDTGDGHLRARLRRVRVRRRPGARSPTRAPSRSGWRISRSRRPIPCADAARAARRALGRDPHRTREGSRASGPRRQVRTRACSAPHAEEQTAA